MGTVCLFQDLHCSLIVYERPDWPDFQTAGAQRPLDPPWPSSGPYSDIPLYILRYFPRHGSGSLPPHNVSSAFSPLFTYRIRHDDPGLIAPDSPHQGQADPLVAAGRFHNNGILFYKSFFFRVFYHVIGGPGFNRTAYIQSFKFHKGSARCLPLSSGSDGSEEYFPLPQEYYDRSLYLHRPFQKFIFQRVPGSYTHL